jgi:glycine/D-amino acid oxidase-like deaminating enzyme
MKIAVVGAGLSGLAFAWHYKKNNPKHSLTIFDPLIASERSSSLANLLYPYIGMRSKLNHDGQAALKESIQLLEIASKFSDYPLFREISLFKIPKDSKEKKAFIEASQTYDELQWLSKTRDQKAGLWIQKVFQVQGDVYLEALLKACAKLGVKYQKRLFQEEDENDFDQVIYATGHNASEETSFTLLKGQGLIIKWPSDNFSLDYCLVEDGLHLIPSFDHLSIYVGSTFEREFDDLNPSMEIAKSLLWPKLKSILPQADEGWIKSIKAGGRLTAPNRLPKMGQINQKKWIFTALGSKGLLYHSYLGKILASAVFNQSIEEIPQEYLYQKNPHS